ncbi:MAG TPA: DUF4349 domain-containing protein [Chloroflexota bacterium]|nr:DUF4349 domain-containing protein [Chloroflexota bacterium]
MNRSRLGLTTGLPLRLRSLWPGWRPSPGGWRWTPRSLAGLGLAITAVLVLATALMREVPAPPGAGGLSASVPPKAGEGAPGAEPSQRAADFGAGAAGVSAARDSAASAGAALAPGQAASGQGTLPSVDRLIVKTGSLSLRVADLADAIQQAGQVVTSIPGAYVAASSTSYRAEPGVGAPADAPVARSDVAMPQILPPRPGPGQSATLTIKVPAADFDQAMSRLRGLGTPVQEQVSTQEVTEEFVDLEAQVRNLEAVEQQYVRFMERAQRIEEILPLQQRLTEVRSQIERLRGRMNLLQRRADQATITLTLALPAASDAPWLGPEPRPVRTLRLALVNLGRALQVVLDLLIYVAVYVLPFLPLAVAAYWWRRSRRPAGPAAPAAPATPPS